MNKNIRTILFSDFYHRRLFVQYYGVHVDTKITSTTNEGRLQTRNLTNFVFFLFSFKGDSQITNKLIFINYKIIYIH